MLRKREASKEMGKKDEKIEGQIKDKTQRQNRERKSRMRAKRI